MRFIFSLLAAFLAVAQGIYPDDHWSFSTDLTSEAMLTSLAQKAIDNDSTLIAPNWNAVVKEFANNPKVSFADVNLSANRVRGSQSPGKGGWPTVVFYNKNTGVGGQAYEKVTKDAMCTELGPGKPHLANFVKTFTGAAGHDEL